MVLKVRINRIQHRFSSKCLLLFLGPRRIKKYDAEFCYQVPKEAFASGDRSTGKKYGISESTIRKFTKSLKEREAAHLQVTMELMLHEKDGYTLRYYYY